MTDRELMQMALDALERYEDGQQVYFDEEIEALRARLAQPEPEPVAWWHDMGDVIDLNVSGRGTPLYTAPPQREWEGLTQDERMSIINKLAGQDWVYVIDAIEAKLKEKNT